METTTKKVYSQQQVDAGVLIFFTVLMFLGILVVSTVAALQSSHHATPGSPPSSSLDDRVSSDSLYASAINLAASKTSLTVDVFADGNLCTNGSKSCEPVEIQVHGTSVVSIQGGTSSPVVTVQGSQTYPLAPPAGTLPSATTGYLLVAMTLEKMDSPNVLQHSCFAVPSSSSNAYNQSVANVAVAQILAFLQPFKYGPSGGWQSRAIVLAAYGDVSGLWHCAAWQRLLTVSLALPASMLTTTAHFPAAVAVNLLTATAQGTTQGTMPTNNQAHYNFVLPTQ